MKKTFQGISLDQLQQELESLKNQIASQNQKLDQFIDEQRIQIQINLLVGQIEKQNEIFNLILEGQKEQKQVFVELNNNIKKVEISSTLTDQQNIFSWHISLSNLFLVVASLYLVSFITALGLKDYLPVTIFLSGFIPAGLLFLRRGFFHLKKAIYQEAKMFQKPDCVDILLYFLGLLLVVTLLKIPLFGIGAFIDPNYWSLMFGLFFSGAILKISNK